MCACSGGGGGGGGGLLTMLCLGGNMISTLL